MTDENNAQTENNQATGDDQNAEQNQGTASDDLTIEDVSLDSVFSDDDDSAQQAQANKQEQGEQKSESEKGEQSDGEDDDDEAGDGDGSDDSEQEDGDGEPPSSEGKSVPKQALLDERRKRQELEDRLKKYESLGNVSQQEQGQQQEKAQVPDPVADPEGFAEYQQNQSNQANMKTRIDLSRSMLSETKQDFAEKEKVFLGLVAQKDAEGNVMVDKNGHVVVADASLWRQFLGAENPALFAYEHASKHMAYQKYSDPDYEKNLRDEITKSVTAELEKKFKAQGVGTDGVPNLTQSASAKSNHAQKVEDEESLDAVFADD